MNPIMRLGMVPAGVIGGRLRSWLVLAGVQPGCRVGACGLRGLDDGLIAVGCWHRYQTRASTQAKGEALEAAYSRHSLRRPARMDQCPGLLAWLASLDPAAHQLCAALDR